MTRCSDFTIQYISRWHKTPLGTCLSFLEGMMKEILCEKTHWVIDIGYICIQKLVEQKLTRGRGETLAPHTLYHDPLRLLMFIYPPPAPKWKKILNVVQNRILGLSANRSLNTETKWENNLNCTCVHCDQDATHGGAQVFTVLSFNSSCCLTLFVEPERVYRMMNNDNWSMCIIYV